MRRFEGPDMQSTGLLTSQSMRNNLRQLPALTFSRKPGGILRGWDLAVERNEEPHLRVSQSLVFVSVGDNIMGKLGN